MLQEPKKPLPVPISLGRKKKCIDHKLILLLNSDQKTMTVRFIKLLSSIFALSGLFCGKFLENNIYYLLNITNIVLDNRKMGMDKAFT